MYDRAARVLTQPLRGTPADVGPGSYDSEKYSHKQFGKRNGFAPFLSMALRESFLTIKDEFKIMSPSPCAYDPKVNNFVKGASTLANKEYRFIEKSDETPGPGSYELSKQSDWLKNKFVAETPSNVSTQSPGAKVSFYRKPDPPSIPSPGQSYGYEEGSDGNLQKQKIPERDKTLGPAFYRINYDETNAEKKYKGIHFGKMTSSRVRSTKDQETPGPGQYDPYKPKPKGPIDFILEEKKKKPTETNLPRYHELVTIFETKKAVPGPGHYQIKSQFEGENRPSDGTTRHAFASQAKRFAESSDCSPAPGSYNDPRHSLELCNRIAGLKKSPFGQTATRFPKEHHVRKTPGPGTYNYLDLANQLKKKAIVSSAMKGGFGSTATRTTPLNKKDDDWLPGPTHYVIKSAPTSRAYRKQAVFESTSNRFQTARRDTAPPPGSYEVSRSYDKTQGKVLYIENLERKSAKMNGGFLSSTKRFSQPRDIIVKKTDLDNPGPGYYKTKKPEIQGGTLVTKQDRFKPLKNDIPGPGTYQLSPLLQHSVLKSTFNATLSNPVAMTIEEIAEKKTSHLPFTITT